MSPSNEPCGSVWFHLELSFNTRQKSRARFWYTVQLFSDRCLYLKELPWHSESLWPGYKLVAGIRDKEQNFWGTLPGLVQRVDAGRLNESNTFVWGLGSRQRCVCLQTGTWNDCSIRVSLLIPLKQYHKQDTPRPEASSSKLE